LDHDQTGRRLGKWRHRVALMGKSEKEKARNKKYQQWYRTTDAGKASQKRGHDKSRTEEGRKKRAAQAKKYYASPKGQIRDRIENLRAYGLTPDQHDEMLANQAWCCAICGIKAEASYKGLHIDHNHETGKVRGLLCMHCNQGLGKFGDSPERLELAAKYLREI
jgi:hypothetical protein